MKKNKWNVISMIGWIVLTFFISPVGIVVGALNLKFEERKNQAIVLLVVGLVSMVLWILHFSGQHH
jgi:membrane protease YdiL (CAAX protease family)